MCGVIGLVFGNDRGDLGRIAAELLKTLEYRGYDSTGAAIQGAAEDVWLAKGVGAPSIMVDQLGITRAEGRVFCGQVRWATFGAVTDANSQPHVVRCKTFLYGAHNGNVTNCDELKTWLTSEGHTVLSDNDGEMVVHTVEHYFAGELHALPEASRREPDARRAAMRRAILTANKKLIGSFAAVIVDPVTRTLWAIKKGSSLYFGFGATPDGERFGIASSDLSSILKLTRVLLPLSEGEMVEYDSGRHTVYAVEDRTMKTPTGPRSVRAGELLEREPVRSRLRAKDTALVPPFETFMDQEIFAQEHACRSVISLFSGGSKALRALTPALDRVSPAALAEIEAGLDAIRDLYDDAHIAAAFHALVDLPAFAALLDAAQGASAPLDLPSERLAERLASSEAGFFADLIGMARTPRDVTAVAVLDAILERDEVREHAAAVARVVDICAEAVTHGGRLYVVCCGSSQHAAKAGCLFFNELARTELIPILPGEFRGQYAHAIDDGDVFVAVSQSGETKDLIDVMNDVIASGKRIARVSLVNNVNSTLAQEKSDVVVPLRCGPEVAVPATKSFMNQLLAFYCLALALGDRRASEIAEPAARAKAMAALALRRETFHRIPDLLRETFEATDADTELAARLLYLKPSMQILATRLTAVAKEGALKIREVVLNHAEGFEASEFKHGPNTILGFNTIWGPAEVGRMLENLGRTLRELLQDAVAQHLGPESLIGLAQATTDAVFSARSTPFALTPQAQAIFEAHMGEAGRNALVQSLYGDYPLLFVTGPDERDIALTVSQINTHKIRGASTVVIAEEHPSLRGAAEKAPIDNPSYKSVFIALPRTDDVLLTTFSATLVLQRLALKMSLLKMHYLDRLGIKDHGVHPDVPKNVSKSITVD
jgi:glucosamine 6-phosphate synthetase-like amidotransferase/phosphosugar isomerase protein